MLLPTPVLEYLHTQTIAYRTPAYLLVKDGLLSQWGGNLETYRITELQEGEAIESKVFFLEGIFPLKESSLFLPCLQTGEGQTIDVHIFSGEEGDWVLFLDASTEEIQQREIQQKWNDLYLIIQKQNKIVNQYSTITDMKESIIAELLATLNIVIMERLEAGYFRILGTLPDWFLQFYPQADFKRDSFHFDDPFLFLNNFLIDAEEFWAKSASETLKSGAWIEGDWVKPTSQADCGNNYQFEATAVCLPNQKILLIELLGITYEEKCTLFQKARENSLIHYNLLKEIQNKEILLHCIVHDLAGQLTAIRCSFDLLEFEDLSVKGRQYLEVGREQSIKQALLIQEILDAFSAEIASLKTFVFNPDQAPNIVNCAETAIKALSPKFLQNEINLQLEQTPNSQQDWRVVGEQLHLERILTNLIENAFRYSSTANSVIVNVQGEEKTILITVDDEGSGVSPELSPNLFQKFSQGKDKSGKVGLGLYFCRITVERWGGSIGYSPRPSGGSRFWFRLHRQAAFER